MSMSEFAPICISLVISSLVSLILLGLLFIWPAVFDFIRKRFYGFILITEKPAIDFFHKITFISFSFLFYIFCSKYFMVFDSENVCGINPLCVISQLSLLYFNFHNEGDIKAKHLTLICLEFSIVCTLYLKGVYFGVFFYLIFVFSVVIYIFNFTYVPLIVLLFYFLDVGLAKWGFFLLFQQVAYYFLSFFLDEKEMVPPTRLLISMILLLNFQVVLGLLKYNQWYLNEPCRLAVLLSGACIIFICKKKRSNFAFSMGFFLYFFLSLLIGCVSSPVGLDVYGITIFIVVHFLFFWFVKLFIRAARKQTIVPFLFCGLFYILPHFPHLQWISEWIEGFDYLLFFLSILSFSQESGGRKEK